MQCRAQPAAVSLGDCAGEQRQCQPGKRSGAAVLAHPGHTRIRTGAHRRKSEHWHFAPTRDRHHVLSIAVVGIDQHQIATGAVPGRSQRPDVIGRQRAGREPHALFLVGLEAGISQ